MARTALKKKAKREVLDKHVSLKVLPQDPGSTDIHVEITRDLSLKKRGNQRKTTIAIITIMLLFILPMVRDLAIYFQMKEEYRELTQTNQELLAIKQQLEEEREALHSEEIIERLAREELDMVMPGESKVFQAIPTEDMPEREIYRSGEALH